MKKSLSALVTLALFFACTPDNNNGSGTQNNPNEITVTGEALDITDYSATLTGYANLPFELGDAEVGIMYDKQQSFEDVRKVAATGLDGNNKFTVSVTGLEPSTTYYFKSYVQNGMAVKCGTVKSFATKESTIPVDAVDLGLSAFWGTTNIGASKPEDYGDYYAWGETEPKSDYSWSTYNHYEPFPDGLSNGDVAHVRLGGQWRIPSQHEWGELLNQCTWTLTSDYNGTGVKGVIVTATNGNSIFLPAAGYLYETDLYDAGSKGHYWSSSDGGSYDSSWSVHFYTGSEFDCGGFGWGFESRCYGLSVRPVVRQFQN